jgi:hypothetical protein
MGCIPYIWLWTEICKRKPMEIVEFSRVLSVILRNGEAIGFAGLIPTGCRQSPGIEELN